MEKIELKNSALPYFRHPGFPLPSGKTGIFNRFGLCSAYIHLFMEGSDAEHSGAFFDTEDPGLWPFGQNREDGCAVAFSISCKNCHRFGATLPPVEAGMTGGGYEARMTRRGCCTLGQNDGCGRKPRGAFCYLSSVVCLLVTQIRGHSARSPLTFSPSPHPPLRPFCARQSGRPPAARVPRPAPFGTAPASGFLARYRAGPWRSFCHR